MEKQTKIDFYERFVDENNLSTISNYKNRKKYWSLYFWFLVFLGAFAVIPTFVGYNFKHPFSIIMFCWTILFFFVSLILFFSLLHLDKEYKVIKSKKAFLLLNTPLFIIAILIDVFAIFTTTFVPFENGGFKIELNPFFFFFVFLPFFFGYIVFLYYAFIKSFAKYIKK